MNRIEHHILKVHDEKEIDTSGIEGLEDKEIYRVDVTFDCYGVVERQITHFF